jgi:hypothetical protein
VDASWTFTDWRPGVTANCMEATADLSKGDVLQASLTHEAYDLGRVVVQSPSHRLLVARERIPAGAVVLSVPAQASFSTFSIESHPVSVQ